MAATAIFVGYVSEVKTSSIVETYFIDVEESFKGVTGKKVKVIARLSHCFRGYRLNKGEKYLVYAIATPSEELETRECGAYARTRPISEAEEDLKFLRNRPQKGNGGRIDLLTVGLNEEPVPNIQLGLKGGSVSHNLETDNRGRYEASGLRPGKYRVEMNLPLGYSPLTGVTHEVQVDEGSCNEVKFYIDELDLAQIGHISSKGRVQDSEYNNLEIVTKLIERSTRSIPFLISKLEEEAKTMKPVMDFWSKTTVGDIALIILVDFFTDSTWKKATIDGVGWDEILERRTPDLTAEDVLRNYIREHGRGAIRMKWEKVWRENKDRLDWDEIEKCFRIK